MRKGMLICWIMLLAGMAKGQLLNVYVNDSIYRAEPVVLTVTDSVNGTLVANYANYPGVMAYKVNYYNGYRTGFVKYFYPSGKLMMTQVYQKSKLNGEYALYDEEGKLVIKGIYLNNIKDGYWAYMKYDFRGKYKNGLKHGRWSYVNPEGKKRAYYYKKGVLQKTKLPVPVIPSWILKDGTVKP